jgi:hypothetical protein
MARTMSNELNPPTKRRHDYPSAFPYSGHAADCNCSCYLKDTRSSQQQYCTGHESSFNPVGSYTAPDTLRNSGNDWRTSRTRLAESHPNPSSVQSFKPIGDILDLPPVQFSDNWSDSPNLGICDREGVHEPVSSDSPWMPQTLWDSGRLMKTFLEPKERNDSEHLVKDIRSSNSNEPSGISPETQGPLLSNSNNA